MSDDVVSNCQNCGASVYRQHLETGIARYEGTRLMCAHCVEEFEAKGAGSGERFEPIVLEEEEDDAPVAAEATSARSSTRIQAFGGSSVGAASGWNDGQYKRPLDPKSPGASRCRTFHTKLNDAAVAFMNTNINEWLDANPDITIKFATSTIGVFEGKHADPNLIVTVFY